MYHILICDDEQDIVNALKIYLMNPDFKLFEANTGVQALEVMEREDIHLILLDIMMPEMDGISAMVKIREKSNVPIILLTAKSEDTDKILGLNTGADDYITKPFNPVEVTARVRSQLRRYMQLGSRAAATARYVIGGVELELQGSHLGRRTHFLDAHRIRHPQTAHGESRQGVFPQGDLSAGMERGSPGKRQYRCRTYPASP